MKTPAIEGGTPVRESFLVFGSPQIMEDEIQEVVSTLRSGWLGTGPKTNLFETNFKVYVGSKHAIALNSCTAGLHLALDVIGVNEGETVITSPITFASTANIIVHHRAVPVFVDVDRLTMNIDPQKLEDKIKELKAQNARVKAIVPVHFAGRPCEMDAIMDMARQHNLYVIEDAAHAIETVYKGKKVGSIGDFTTFSFYVTKNVVTGEGGMVTTNDDKWAEEMRIKSLHGISKDAWSRYSGKGFQPYETFYPGYKYNMTDILASLGIHQLARVDDNHKIREKYWRMYNEAFSEIEELIIPVEQDDIKHARHMYTILLILEHLKINRNQFIEALKAENIGTGIHFTALHLHKYYRETFGYKLGDFPNAEFISDRTISLPLSAKLIEKDVQDVIKAVKKVISYYRI